MKLIRDCLVQCVGCSAISSMVADDSNAHPLLQSMKCRNKSPP